MSDLIFYTNPMSRGQIARWMLEEVGEAYEQRLLDYGTTMKAAEYLAVNPMGKVPAIVHKGHVVTEGAAICAYLADAFSDSGLAPPPPERADYYRWLFFAAGPVEQAVTNQALHWTPTEKQRMTVGYGSYDEVLDTLEKAIKGKRFIAGERFSAADVYVGSHIDWGLQFGTIGERQSFIDYVTPLRERPAYRKAKEIDGALIAAMKKEQEST